MCEPTKARSSEAKKEKLVSLRKKTDQFQSISQPQKQILALQRTAGNQAVGRLIRYRFLKTRTRNPGDIYEQEAVMRMPQVSDDARTPGSGEDLSQVRVIPTT